MTEKRAAAEVDRVVPGVDAATSAFLVVRPRLFRIAYRVLAEAGEAEDVVQEVWIRWQGADHTVISNPAAFLATATRRLALNVAQSARRRRETSVESPESTPEVPTSGDPEAVAESGEAVGLAVWLLLETLTPSQRAAYVLREAFDYPYREISETLQLDAANTRQLVRRAHLSVVGGRRRPVDQTAHRRLVEAFLGAARAGDLHSLEEILVDGMVS